MQISNEDEIKSSHHPAEKLSTATLLDRQKQFIMVLWATKVKDLIPAAQLQDRPALYNALPQLMDEIGNALSLIGFGSDARKEVSKEHAQQRASLEGYNLKQILSEMRILRETIFEVLEKESGPLAQRERDIILDSIEKGIIVTGAEFMKIQIEEKNQEIVETIEVAKQAEIDLSESQSMVDKLEAEQKLRDLFVATLTHDLRTPLTSAKLGAQMIRRKISDPEYIEKCLIKIDMGLDRADNMIETLLDANQMQTGQSLAFTMKEFDLAKEISDLTTEISEISRREIIFKNSLSPFMCHLACDKVRRAVENLLTNAIKYGDTERPITVELLREDKMVKISVHNFGKPIPTADQASIFEPFFRAKTVRVENQKGWGLGLTLVKGIVEAHGGSVELISNLADGTTFSLIFPLDARALGK